MDTNAILMAGWSRLSVPEQVEFNDLWTAARRKALKAEVMEYKGGQYVAMYIDLPVYLGKRDGKGMDRSPAGYSKGYIERSLRAMRLLEEGYRKTNRKVTLLDPERKNGKLKYPGRLLVATRPTPKKAYEVSKEDLMKREMNEINQAALAGGCNVINVIADGRVVVSWEV